MADIKSGIQKESSRLLTERPALESEMKTVFAVIDHAPHMTPILREEIHGLYDHRLENLTEDISGIRNHLKEIGGGDDGVS